MSIRYNYLVIHFTSKCSKSSSSRHLHKSWESLHTIPNQFLFSCGSEDFFPKIGTIGAQSLVIQIPQTITFFSLSLLIVAIALGLALLELLNSQSERRKTISLSLSFFMFSRNASCCCFVCPSKG
ncbi:MAG: hypothetical protein BWY04_00547 [candidate division CPR1 bacterium ADurb.Bin160]|jgi:hypothetical protein|uniref:Uncharacterized protein n=1 Tax=candidate division CPR1 bacterium ADurb.Bin160 TaxID=1852826 RepID=A0A1V5ZQ21_9BACT|nr:MAG: hypothetical protein BWY04_00547 [candidate division CPR1 bacterium ADurb.Bin160]